MLYQYLLGKVSTYTPTEEEEESLCRINIY